MQDFTAYNILVHYPLVSEDAPEWKKICPFCGAYDTIHEAEDTYVCYECLANWIEHDTETERQIQLLHLNYGKMPRWGEGEMPLVERTFYKYTSNMTISFVTMTATLFDDYGNPIEVRSLTDLTLPVLFKKEGKNYDECAQCFHVRGSTAPHA